MVKVSERFLRQITQLAKESNPTVDSFFARIINASNPIDSQDLATKSYVDSLNSSITIQEDDIDVDGYVSVINFSGSGVSAIQTSPGNVNVHIEGISVDGYDGYMPIHENLIVSSIGQTNFTLNFNVYSNSLMLFFDGVKQEILDYSVNENQLVWEGSIGLDIGDVVEVYYFTLLQGSSNIIVPEIQTTLDKVLLNGNETNGTDIDLTLGSRIKSSDGYVGIDGLLDVNGDVNISGKLNVDGLIDPTGLVLNEQETSPYNPANNGGIEGLLWVRNDGYLIFTNQENQSIVIREVLPGQDGQIYVTENNFVTGFESTAPGIVETINGTDLVICSDASYAARSGFGGFVGGSIQSIEITNPGTWALPSGSYDLIDYTTNRDGISWQSGGFFACYIDLLGAISSGIRGGSNFRVGDTITINSINGIESTSGLGIVTVTGITDPSYIDIIRTGITHSNDGVSFTSENPPQVDSSDECVQFVKTDSVSGKTWAFTTKTVEDVAASNSRYSSKFYEITSTTNPMTWSSGTILRDMLGNVCYTITSIAVDPNGYFWISTSAIGDSEISGTRKVLKWDPVIGATIDEFNTYQDVRYHSMEVDTEVAKYGDGYSRLIVCYNNDQSFKTPGYGRVVLNSEYTYETNNAVPTGYAPDSPIGITLDINNNLMWSICRYGDGNFRLFKANIHPFLNVLYDIELLDYNLCAPASFIFDINTQKGFCLFVDYSVNQTDLYGYANTLVIAEDSGINFSITSQEIITDLPQVWSSPQASAWSPKPSIINENIYIPLYGMITYVFGSELLHRSHIIKINPLTNERTILGKPPSLLWKDLDSGDLSWDSYKNIRVSKITDSGNRTFALNNLEGSSEGDRYIYIDYNEGDPDIKSKKLPISYFYYDLSQPVSNLTDQGLGNQIYKVTTAGITINLPTSSGPPTTGSEITIKDLTGNASVAPITINGNGSNIDGGTSVILNNNYGLYHFKYDGTIWVTIGSI
jgi:hypothetical protein